MSDLPWREGYSRAGLFLCSAPDSGLSFTPCPPIMHVGSTTVQCALAAGVVTTPAVWLHR